MRSKFVIHFAPKNLSMNLISVRPVHFGPFNDSVIISVGTKERAINNKSGKNYHPTIFIKTVKTCRRFFRGIYVGIFTYTQIIQKKNV